jgi:hypothetical protein
LAAHRNSAPLRVFGAMAILALALIWTAALRAPLWRVDGPDDAFYAEVAHLWTLGALPYVGAFEVKPPGLFALLALAQSWLGPNLDALRTVAVCCDAVAAANLFLLGRRFGSTALGVYARPALTRIAPANSERPSRPARSPRPPRRSAPADRRRPSDSLSSIAAAGSISPPA